MRITLKSLLESSHIGLAREFIFEYFLKKRSGLMSDDAHTEFGKKYWDKLLKDAVNKGYRVFLVNKTERVPLKTLNDINKYYMLSPRGLDYRFLILK